MRTSDAKCVQVFTGLDAVILFRNNAQVNTPKNLEDVLPQSRPSGCGCGLAGSQQDRVIGHCAHGRHGWEETAQVLVDDLLQQLFKMAPLRLGYAHCHCQTLSESRNKTRVIQPARQG